MCFISYEIWKFNKEQETPDIVSDFIEVDNDTFIVGHFLGMIPDIKLVANEFILLGLR